MTSDLRSRSENRTTPEESGLTISQFTREMIMILMLHEEVLVQLNEETLNSAECKSVWFDDLLKNFLTFKTKRKEMYSCQFFS